MFRYTQTHKMTNSVNIGRLGLSRDSVEKSHPTVKCIEASLMSLSTFPLFVSIKVKLLWTRKYYVPQTCAPKHCPILWHWRECWWWIPVSNIMSTESSMFLVWLLNPICFYSGLLPLKLYVALWKTLSVATTKAHLFWVTIPQFWNKSPVL